MRTTEQKLPLPNFRTPLGGSTVLTETLLRTFSEEMLQIQKWILLFMHLTARF